MVLILLFLHILQVLDHDNATVVNVVSKYYNLARAGDAPLAFLHCNGYKKERSIVHLLTKMDK